MSFEINEKRRIADVHLHCRFIRQEDTLKMLEDISSLGITDACLQALPYRSAAENLFMLYMKMILKAPRIRAFGVGGLHVTDRYAAIAPKSQAETLLELGCDGIKLMFSPDLQRYYGRGIDDPYYEPMFQMLEERDVPVLIHLADPETFWEAGRPYEDPSFPTKKCMYEEAFRMLDRHPNLRVCFAHFFFLSNFPDEAVRVMEKYPKVCFDLTPGVEMYHNFDKELGAWKQFFEKYSHRILFGTDCNIIKSCNKELELLVYRKLTEKERFTQNCYGRDFNVEGLGLTRETIERICYQNYFDFIGEKPKEVNIEKFCSCCERIIKDLDENEKDDEYIRGGELIPDLKKDPRQRIAYDFCQMALSRFRQ